MSVSTKNGTSNMRKHLKFAYNRFKLWEAASKYDVQTGLGTSADGSLGFCKVSEAVVREATNEMLVLGELPLSFIESLAWRHFCSRVQLFNPKSRRTATRDIVELYVKKKTAMKKILGENKQRLSLTTDIWVCPHIAASYIVITAHFVDAWWKLRKLIIGFKNVYDNKGSTISKCLIDCLAEWDIKRVFCITVDNATPNSSAMRRFKEEFKKDGNNELVLNGEYLHLRCAAHILNLVVKEGLLDIDKSVTAIRNCIQFVRFSTPRQRSFETRMESGRLQRGSLPLDIKTRWNSTFLMLEQAIEFKLVFEKMEAEDKPYNDYFNEIVGGEKRIGPPTTFDWDEVDRLVKFLTIFYKSTLTLSASISVCSHKLYNEIVSIYRNIKAVSISSGPDDPLTTKVLYMLGKLGKYWDPFGTEVEMNRLVIVATVFDPSKKMKYAQLCFEKLYGKESAEIAHLYDSIMDILESHFDEYSDVASRSGSGPSGGSMASTQSQSQEQFRDEIFGRTVLVNGVQLYE